MDGVRLGKTVCQSQYHRILAVASALLETPEFAPQPPAAITVGRTSAAAKMRAMFFFIAFVLLFLFYFNLNYIPIMSNTSKEIIT